MKNQISKTLDNIGEILYGRIRRKELDYIINNVDENIKDSTTASRLKDGIREYKELIVKEDLVVNFMLGLSGYLMIQREMVLPYILATGYKLYTLSSSYNMMREINAIVEFQIEEENAQRKV